MPARVRGIPLVVNVVRVLFLWIIQRVTAGLRAFDLVRLCIFAAGLDKPISTKLMTVAELTIEKVLATIMKVLQSKDTIELDDGFVVDAITVRRDIGGGYKRLTNVMVDRLGKKSIVSIPFDNEGLCCAKAIVMAQAYLANNRKLINALKKPNRPALMNRARALHEAAGVPLGPCTYTEVAQFEAHLDLQIVVFSTENLNKVCKNLV